MSLFTRARASASRRAAISVAGALFLGCGLASTPTRADDSQTSQATDTKDGYFADWFRRVDAIQAAQPHWMTPLVTVTPRLEEEFRFDTNWSQLPSNGARLTNIGGGKGLELIPWDRVELLFNLPPYEQRSWNGANSTPVAGFGDWPVVMAKYRLASANEQNGNYIVTAFLGVSAPTGVDAFTAHRPTVTPTIAAGKGWGDFDIQTTLGETVPFATVEHSITQAVAWNTAFQYHVNEYFWPEFEVNELYWPNGIRGGERQTLLTPGIIFGRFPIAGRTKAIVGVGYQVAVTPAVPTVRNNLVVTSRLAF